MTFRTQLDSKSPKHFSLLDAPEKKIKKRHWLLASSAILIGSWITHTTTANIKNKPSIEPITKISIEQSTKKFALTSVIKFEPFKFIAPKSLVLKNQPDLNNSNVKNEKETLQEVTHKISKGESLGTIFKKLGLDMSIPHKISQHESAKKLVSLSVGKELLFKTNKENSLHSITYQESRLKEFTVSFTDNKITNTEVTDLPFQTHQQIASGEITSSLYEAALEVGMSNSIVMEMVRVFGWDVDFVKDIRSGDHFHVIYESHTMNDKWLSDGNILAAEFTTQGQTYRAIRFEDEHGEANFYNPEGQSMLGTFLRSPVEFSRISSRFGKRKHPILKTWRAHNGVDYAAKRGTPIRTTASGKIVHVGKKGGYGRTVVITHAGRFSTLYAHMNGYAKGLKVGDRVKQGETIGYVGSSGLATGPHLHYEFRVDGVHRNSLTYKTPKASSISAKSKVKFETIAAPMLAQLDSIDQNYKLAKSSAKDAKKVQL